MNLSKFGYLKISTICPRLYLGNPIKNSKEIIKTFKKAKGSLVLYPELSLTGYTCEDYFYSQELQNKTNLALEQVIKETKKINKILVLGMPFKNIKGTLFNCAVIIFKGKILGIVPKIYRPNMHEFYEKRWFSSGLNVSEEIIFLNQKFLLASNQIFDFGKLKLGVEICEDLWAPIAPSAELALGGANVILNLSASNELIHKKEYREELVRVQSAKLNCVYAYCSAGIFESSKDIVFGGHQIVSENGTTIVNSDRFNLKSSENFCEVDLDKIESERSKNKSFGFSSLIHNKKNIRFKEDANFNINKIYREYRKRPFIPNKNSRSKVCEEILTLQEKALARRLLSINKPKIILGLSGGLDSTLALIVALRAVKTTKQSIKDIICISTVSYTHLTLPKTPYV